jgi:large conductance mechanosensitive channel
MSSTNQNRHDYRQEFGRVGHYAKDTLGGFRTFILRGNVIDLAIGIVIGAAFTSVVNALVSNVITPLIPVPGNSLAGLAWQVPYAKQGVMVNLGALISAVISFLIVALVLYFFVVRPVSAFMSRYNPPPKVESATRDCPYCLQSIPLRATRCSFCTSPLPPADTNAGAPLATQPGRND